MIGGYLWLFGFWNICIWYLTTLCFKIVWISLVCDDWMVYSLKCVDVCCSLSWWRVESQSCCGPQRSNSSFYNLYLVHQNCCHLSTDYFPPRKDHTCRIFYAKPNPPDELHEICFTVQLPVSFEPSKQVRNRFFLLIAKGFLDKFGGFWTSSHRKTCNGSGSLESFSDKTSWMSRKLGHIFISSVVSLRANPVTWSSSGVSFNLLALQFATCFLFKRFFSIYFLLGFCLPQRPQLS